MVKNFFYRRGDRKVVTGVLQPSIKWLNKEIFIFCFWTFLCLLDLRICFCLKRGRHGLEFRIQFNRYSMRSFHWPFHWWDLITFKSILLLESLIQCPCLKYLVHHPKWRVELGAWEVVFSRSRGNRIFIWPM